MYQILCHSCKEPVSQEFDKPVLEEGAIVICRSCLAIERQAMIAINTERHQDVVMLDAIMAKELAAQFGGKLQ